MASDVGRLRRLLSRKRVSSSGHSECEPQTAALDPYLSFVPSSGEKWTFRDESGILVDGLPIGELVDEGRENAGVLGGLLQGLFDYQQHIWSLGGREKEKFNAAVLSMEGKIQGRLGELYDGLTGGVKFECADGNFWINNVSIRAVLDYYRRNPSENVRIYLSGFRFKLGLILEHRQSSTRYDGIERQARELYEEISVAIECPPPDVVPRLTDGRRVA